MGQFILFSYILIFSSGFAGLFSLVVMRIRIRSRVLIPLLAFYASLLVALGVVAVFFYLKNIQSLIGGEFSSLEFALTLVSTLVNISIYAAFIAIAAHALSAKERQTAAARVFRALCFIIMLCLAAQTALSLFGGIALPTAFSILLYAIIGATVTLLGILLYRAKASGEHAAVRFLIRGTAIACFFFIPLSAVEFILQTAGVQPYRPLSVEYAFLLCLNVLAIIAAVRSLAAGGTTVPMEISDDTASRYALTNREREMIFLIARGMTNKEIGYELGISAATVRTHIYNLFQKTEVQSRIALINKITAETSTT